MRREDKNYIKMKILIKSLVLMLVIINMVGCSKIPIENQIPFPQFVLSISERIDGTEADNKAYISDFIKEYRKYDFENSSHKKYYDLAKSYANGDISKQYISEKIKNDYRNDLKEYMKNKYDEE